MNARRVRRLNRRVKVAVVVVAAAIVVGLIFLTILGAVTGSDKPGNSEEEISFAKNEKMAKDYIEKGWHKSAIGSLEEAARWASSREEKIKINEMYLTIYRETGRDELVKKHEDLIKELTKDETQSCGESGV